MSRNLLQQIQRRVCFLTVCLLVLAGVQMGSGIYIYCKAQLAQFLLQDAWQKTLQQHQPIKPWPWADTWPVAKLTAPQLHKELIVLAGAEGRSLAFAPGHSTGSAQAGEAGITVIGGHRDTHFEFLQDLKIGDLLRLQSSRGYWFSYRIIRLDIINSLKVALDVTTDESLLTLVTCYPFDAIRAGGELRYVVTAELTRQQSVARSIVL